jgi:hypothetical protein
VGFELYKSADWQAGGALDEVDEVGSLAVRVWSEVVGRELQDCRPWHGLRFNILGEFQA